MDSNLETPYEEEDEFIECTVCDKSIRGETLYKIHLTTPGHIKKEDAIVASGRAVRKHHIPIFEDIVQYLDYMKLDEPIIGLNFLDELPCSDPQSGPRYACRLCNQNANLSETVRHVIGRKHRQRYVEMKRPDLVTWTKQSIITHGGKIIRAKAEIVERQDGQGCPTKLQKRGIEGRLNISRVPQRQKQYRDQNISQNFTQRDVPPLLPELKNYRKKTFHPQRYPPGDPYTPPFHPEDSYMLNRDRPMYQQEDALSFDRVEDELQRADYRENDLSRREYMEPDYRMEYEDKFVEDPERRVVLEPGGVSKYDSREELPRGPEDFYPEEASPYRSSYPDRDQLKEFYSEEVRRGRFHSDKYQPSQLMYPKDNEQRRSLDRETHRHDSMYRAGRQGSSEPEAKRRSFPTPVESERPRDHLFVTTRDYCHGMREPHLLEADADPGPSRCGPPTSQRQVEVTRAMSDIPEPFRRFLKGASNGEEHGKRKRKSRFSDATAEEVETTKEMFSDEYGPPNPKFGRHPRPEVQGPQHPDLYTQSQSLPHTESYQRGDSDSRGVFDMLKNIEIENAEEADFLKSELCNLLREFKSKKSEKAQNSQGRAAIPKDYNSINPDPELSPRHQYDQYEQYDQYDTTLRQDFDHRRPENLYFKEDHRGRSWQQHERPNERNTPIQEYQYPVREEVRQSNRNRYKDVFRRPGMSRMPPAKNLDEPEHNPERFQEPMHPRDNRPATDELFDLHTPAPPFHMERGPRMNRGPQYSNNLDKITSTLLEFVTRK